MSLSKVITTGVVSGASGSSNIYVEQHELITPTQLGRYAYTIPVGGWFQDRASDTSLDINVGGGIWVPQAYGPDYGHLRRSTPPASVADLCIGWTLAGPPPGGWIMRFRWKVWRMRDKPEMVVPVRLVGGAGTAVDYSIQWYMDNAAACTDAVQVEPPVDGVQIEFWKRIRRTGGLRDVVVPIS